MGVLIWIGTAVVLAGLAGLGFCMQQSLKARRLAEAEAKVIMARVVVWNLAAMGVAVLGLMTVVMGLVLR